MFSKCLKYYRLLNNMSKKDLANRVHVTPMSITHYEQGKRNPDMEVLKRLAAVFGIQVSDFLTHRVGSVEVSFAEFRKNTKLSEKKQEFLKEAIEEYFERFFSALEYVSDMSLPNAIPYHATALTGKIEEDAVQMRHILGLPENGPIGNLVLMLENIGVLVVFIDVDDTHFSGINGVVNEYPYIAINSNMTPERIRSTIVHELAHIIFKWDNYSDDKEIEKYATAISGAFLISEKDLIRELGPHRYSVTEDFVIICREYGISSWLLVKRAEQTHIISPSAAKDFYVKASKAGWKLHEPSRIEPELPTLFYQLVYRAVNEREISIQKGAELLKTSHSEVERACQQMEGL